MLKRIALLGMLSLLFSICLTPAFTAPAGNQRVYLPITTTGAPILPNEPLMLTYRSHDNQRNSIDLIRTDGDHSWTVVWTNAYNIVMSPNQKMVVYEEYAPDTGSFVVNIDGTNRRRIARFSDPNAATFQAWAPTSEGIAFQEPTSGTWTLRYTPLTETAFTVATDTIADAFAWTPAGDRLVYSAIRNGQQDIFIAPREGGAETLLFQSPTQDWLYTATPDGHWVVGRSNGAGVDVLLLNADGSNPTPLFTLPTVDTSARLKIAVDTTGQLLFPYYEAQSPSAAIPIRLYTISGEVVWTLEELCELSPDNTCHVKRVAWQPNGNQVVFEVWHQAGQYIEPRLYRIRTDGSETNAQVLHDQSDASVPYFSPDGRYLAYFGSETVFLLDTVTGDLRDFEQFSYLNALMGWVLP